MDLEHNSAEIFGNGCPGFFFFLACCYSNKKLVCKISLDSLVLKDGEYLHL